MKMKMLLLLGESVVRGGLLLILVFFILALASAENSYAQESSIENEQSKLWASDLLPIPETGSRSKCFVLTAIRDSLNFKGITLFEKAAQRLVTCRVSEKTMGRLKDQMAELEGAGESGALPSNPGARPLLQNSTVRSTVGGLNAGYGLFCLNALELAQPDLSQVESRIKAACREANCDLSEESSKGLEGLEKNATSQNPACQTYGLDEKDLQFELRF